MKGGAVRSHCDLIAWQKAMELVEEIYRMTKELPKEELYGLASQMRRAAVSVPSNIAEGHARTGTREFLHHLSIAQGSLAEVETHVEIARRLGYITGSRQTLLSEIGRLINGLMNSLEKHAAAH